MSHKLRFFISLLTIYICVSCTSSSQINSVSKQPKDLDGVIDNLDTQQKKEEFLIKISELDQEVRSPDRELDILQRNNFDKNSAEYQSYIDRMLYEDSINFIKVKKYLAKYGIPNFEPSNNKLLGAIRLVFMHQPTYEQQLELFPYVHSAYKDSLITADDFSFLLNNMHRHKYGKSYPHAISNEENIQQLLEILDLN